MGAGSRIALHEGPKYFNSLSVYNNFGIPNNNGVNDAPLIPYDQTNITEHNVSPEVTLTYRPSDDWTAFVSYKEGTRAPDSTTTNSSRELTTPGPTLTPEHVRRRANQGLRRRIQGGALAQHLNLTVALYDYKYNGLQVSNYDF